MARAIDLVILDMAGTTVQDAGQVADAFEQALGDADVQVSRDAISRVRGASKRQAIFDLLPDTPERRDRTTRIYDRFVTILGERYAGTARAVPQAAETIARFREDGIRVALNTGFDRQITEVLMHALGWTAAMVDAVACGEDVETGRPAPFLILHCMRQTGVMNPARVANVGDTVLDLRAGHRAAVRFNIGVLSGAHTREMLTREPHTHIIDSVAELPRVFGS
jgi:phosphonatase-like hydrolase